MNEQYPKFAEWLHNLSTGDVLLGIGAVVSIIYLLVGRD